MTATLPVAPGPIPPPLGTMPYVVRVVQDYLAPPDGVPLLGPGVKVCSVAPAQRPPLLVRLETASTHEGPNIVLGWRRLSIFCSATGEAAPTEGAPLYPAELQAANLAELVMGHMKAAEHIPGNGIRAVTTVGTPARLDDPDEDVPRFQLTVDVMLRAHHRDRRAQQKE